MSHPDWIEALRSTARPSDPDPVVLARLVEASSRSVPTARRRGRSVGARIAMVLGGAIAFGATSWAAGALPGTESPFRPDEQVTIRPTDPTSPAPSTSQDGSEGPAPQPSQTRTTAPEPAVPEAPRTTPAPTGVPGRDPTPSRPPGRPDGLPTQVPAVPSVPVPTVPVPSLPVPTDVLAPGQLGFPTVSGVPSLPRTPATSERISGASQSPRPQEEQVAPGR